MDTAIYANAIGVLFMRNDGYRSECLQNAANHALVLQKNAVVGDFMIRAIIALAFCLGMSGCNGVLEVFLQTPTKINKAFPVNTEARVAEENLRTLIMKDRAASSSFDDEYAAMLEIRALTCTQGIKIGRFSSVESIKSLPVSRDCLNEQDSRLMRFLGIRQVAVRFEQGALRPLLPLGQPWSVPLLAGIDIYSADAAAAAGVAVLRGTRSEFVSIEIPGGNKIATLPTIRDASHRVLLSPNGRVAAMQISNNSIIFVDTETGIKLFESSEINQIHAWLPDIHAALVNDSKTGVLSIIDFKTAKIAPHPAGLRGQTWALPVSNSPSRVLVGSGGVFSLIEHAVENNGIQGKLIREYRMSDGRGVTSSPPTLMLGGKAVVFITTRDLKMLNLESGNETFWKTGEFLANRYGKLSESTLMVDSYSINGVSTKPWVFNIDDVTLSPVENVQGSSGILSELAGRLGFMRRESKMWFGDEIKVGEPTALDTLLGSFNLERQIAKLEAETRANESFDKLNRTSSGMFLPAPAVGPQGGGRMSSLGSQAGEVTAIGPIAELARNSQVEALGVYQGKMVAAQATSSERRKGNIEVRIRRSVKPIVLVLSSYEPVRWQLIREPGANLAVVLVSGYYQSEVVGAGAARVVMNGSSFAYKPESQEYSALNRDVMRLTGKKIDVFQGRYEGEFFSVGG